MEQEKGIIRSSVTSVTDGNKADKPTLPTDQSLLGFRGLLAILTILYVVLEIFCPTAVQNSANSKGPQAQLILRKTVSHFLWNPSLIRAGLIIISARTIAIPFLENPSSTKLASVVFRRPFRLLFPIGIALAITTIISNVSQQNSLLEFKEIRGNVSLPTPYRLPSALTYFNSLFTFFWTVRKYPAQAANTAFYNNSLWAISVIYTQSYTVYLAAVIIPFTRPKWRLGAWTFIILTAWWVQSWAWYCISGLLLADAALHMRLREMLALGLPIRISTRRGWLLRLPGWLLGIVLVLAGSVLQFFWKEWRPNYGRGESEIRQAQAREDDYLLIMGLMILIESLPWFRKAIGNMVFVAIGKRSLSIYLVSSIVLNTASISLYLHMIQDRGMTDVGAISVSIVVSLISISLLTEMFYRLVELPTKFTSGLLFDWLRK